MSHGFGADQREDDVVILLTLEPVNCRHLQGQTEMFVTQHTATHQYTGDVEEVWCLRIHKDLIQMFSLLLNSLAVLVTVLITVGHTGSQQS